MKKTRKSGGGRKKLKPEYDAGKNLKEQMDVAAALHDSEMSLQAIGDVQFKINKAFLGVSQSLCKPSN